MQLPGYAKLFSHMRSSVAKGFLLQRGESGATPCIKSAAGCSLDSRLRTRSPKRQTFEVVRRNPQSPQTSVSKPFEGLGEPCSGSCKHSGGIRDVLAVSSKSGRMHFEL